MYNAHNYYSVMLNKDFDTISDIGTFGAWHKHAILDSFFGKNYPTPSPSASHGPPGPPGSRADGEQGPPD